MIHLSQSPNHVLHVAFHNHITASEKRFCGTAVQVRPGPSVARAIYLPAGSDLKGWTTGQFDFLRLELDPGWFRTEPTLRPATPFSDPVLWHMACLLGGDLRNGSPGGALLRDQVRHMLAVHMTSAPLRTLAKPHGYALAPARVRAIREYVQANLHQEIRLGELAALAKLSEFHFARTFKAETGHSPYQYVIAERLKTSRRLLEATALSIAEIAAATGFASPTTFAAAFRRKWGITPSAFRSATSLG